VVIAQLGVWTEASHGMDYHPNMSDNTMVIHNGEINPREARLDRRAIDLFISAGELTVSIAAGYMSPMACRQLTRTMAPSCKDALANSGRLPAIHEPALPAR